MGKLFTVTVILALHCQLYAQSVDKQVRIKDLAAPTSPAFILTDVAPSAVQTPTTPKAFVLGLVKSFDESSGGFPQNYSAEFSPYWLIAPENRSVYEVRSTGTARQPAADPAPMQFFAPLAQRTA